jgi:hypothetical protein
VVGAYQLQGGPVHRLACGCAGERGQRGKVEMRPPMTSKARLAPECIIPDLDLSNPSVVVVVLLLHEPLAATRTSV